MAQAQKNVAPLSRAATSLGSARGQGIGTARGAGQRGGGGRVKAAKSRGRQRSLAGLTVTSGVWSHSRLGPRDRRQLWEGNVPLVCRAPAPPRSPGVMTARAEMTVSSCRAYRQGRGAQSERRMSSSTGVGWRGKTACAAAHSWPAMVGVWEAEARVGAGRAAERSLQGRTGLSGQGTEGSAWGVPVIHSIAGRDR